MVKVDGPLWAILDVLGMVLLAAGAIFVMQTTSPDLSASMALIAAGIVLIVVSSVFIGISGRRFRKEYEEFERFDEIRTGALQVPDDLEEGYLIDYTGEPDNAIRYRDNESKETGLIELDLPQETAVVEKETRLVELFRQETAAVEKETRLKEIDEAWFDEEAQYLYPE